MGTIVARKRTDGSTGYTAQILRKKSGKIVHREAQTFDRRQSLQTSSIEITALPLYCAINRKTVLTRGELSFAGVGNLIMHSSL